MILRRLSALAVFLAVFSMHNERLSAQFMPHGTAVSGWRVIAPNIEVAFEQVNQNSCTWRFRNADTVRTLVTMHFSYTYSALPVSTPRSNARGTENGDDVLPAPLDPDEIAGGPDVYRIQANCTSVTMHVVDTKWV